MSFWQSKLLGSSGFVVVVPLVALGVTVLLKNKRAPRAGLLAGRGGEEKGEARIGESGSSV